MKFNADDFHDHQYFSNEAIAELAEQLFNEWLLENSTTVYKYGLEWSDTEFEGLTPTHKGVLINIRRLKGEK